MADRTLFNNRLFELLNEYDYVLFNYDVNDFRKVRGELTFEFLLRRDDVSGLLIGLKQVASIRNIKVSSNFRFSQVLVMFNDDTSLRMVFLHKFMHKTLTYMDEEAVLERRVLAESGYYLPCIEHQFENVVLHDYLNNGGLKEKYYNYFKEFHVMIQEDLLEFFNKKYGTEFQTVYSLTDFKESERTQIEKHLKALPLNRFVKKVNIRWHNFIGSMRQARMI